MTTPSTENYFKCGGCGRFVAYSQMRIHYEGNQDNGFKPHLLGIAVETPPAPATVANPPAPPTFGGVVTPPVIKMPDSGSIAIDILLMKRSHNKAFWVWTGVVIALTAMAISSIFADIIIFHI